VGAFFHKFLIAPSGETADQIKKVGGAKMARISSITVPSTEAVRGGSGSRAGCMTNMCDVFLFVSLSVCLFVTLLNDEVCDNGNAKKQYNFQNNYGIVA